MNEQNVQIIEKDGEPEYAVVPIEEYRRMVAALEDAAAAKKFLEGPLVATSRPLQPLAALPWHRLQWD